MPSPRSRKSAAYASINRAFGVKAHRFDALPSSDDLGITSTQHTALIHIRRLYGEIADQLGYLTVDQCEAKIAEAEDCIATHFADWWQAKRAAKVVQMEADVEEVEADESEMCAAGG